MLKSKILFNKAFNFYLSTKKEFKFYIKQKGKMQNKLIFLFDGGCPLCLKEISFLKTKDVLNKINFVDINNDAYNPISFKGISYGEAMSNLHGIKENGFIIL